MAAVTRNAVAVTNFEATPRKMNDQQQHGAKTHRFKGTIEVAAADDIGAIFGLMWVHKTWCVDDIKVVCDAVNSGNDNDLGLYSTPGDGIDSSDLNAADTNGDHDVYGAAVDLSSAIAVPTSVMARVPESIANRVWQDAGAASEDAANEWYLLALTCNTEPAAADTVSWLVDVTMPGGA